MGLETPEKIQTLQRKLHLNAKVEHCHKVPSRGIRRFPADTVLGELGVMRMFILACRRVL